MVPSFIVVQNGIQRNVLTDKKYLGGTFIGLCHNLIIPFIKRAHDAMSLVLEELLQFDFWNGLLQQKYNSLKYIMKMIETVLYELSVAGPVRELLNLMRVGVESNFNNGEPTKKMTVDEG